jgi:hypothetical protein
VGLLLYRCSRGKEMTYADERGPFTTDDNSVLPDLDVNGDRTELLAARGLLDFPASLPRTGAETWASTLNKLWTNQSGREPGRLATDLEKLEIFFNPTRKGEAVRTALTNLHSVSIDPACIPMHPGDDRFVLSTGSSGQLVTPEGRILLECLAQALQHDGGAWVAFSPDVTVRTVNSLLDFYRGISRHRVHDVIALLTGESKQTMRPAVAGLLFVLLVNRNTARERALLKYREDRAVADALTRALAAVTAAYAQTFGGESDAINAVNMYRGYAFGELARRLGSSFVNTDTELYITDPDGALSRLAADVAARPADVRLKVPKAVDAAMSAYVQQRPILSALGVAFDRPSNTRRVAEAIRSAVVGQVAINVPEPRSIGTQ